MSAKTENLKRLRHIQNAKPPVCCGQKMVPIYLVIVGVDTFAKGEMSEQAYADFLSEQPLPPVFSCQKCHKEKEIAGLDWPENVLPESQQREPMTAQIQTHPTDSDLITWLHVKIAEAEKSLKAREDMELTWRGGTDKSWAAVGCKMKKLERIQHADMQGRIAVKCRREVEMFKAILERLST